MTTTFEEKGKGYPIRTEFNAKNGDMTIGFAVDFNSAGEKLTKRLVQKHHGENHFCEIHVDQIEPIVAARKIYQMARNYNIKTLNIAGNGIYSYVDKNKNWNQDKINQYVYSVLKQVIEGAKTQGNPFEIQKIYTGGQTGADWAGAVAAHALGIECLVTFPLGFIQRNKNKENIYNNKENLEKTIIKDVASLNKNLNMFDINDYFKDVINFNFN